MSWTRKSPVATAVMVAMSPGIMKEWLSTYFPILVVPVRSKLMAATTVGNEKVAVDSREHGNQQVGRNAQGNS